MSRKAQYTTLAIVALVVAVNYLDRYVLAILIEPIRADLKLTDGQIGLLIGAGFALVYSTLAIPIARLAEHYNRVVILFIAIAVWSSATVVAGFANGFLMLFLAWTMVGCGEAGAMAPSMSMIADLFPKERRGNAMAVIGLGAAAGNTIAPWIGGSLQGVVGWRHTFMIVGLLGLPLALLLVLVVREPIRGQADGAIGARPLPVIPAIQRLFARRTFTLLTLALILMALAEYSMILWLPALFHRSFGIGMSELGPRIALFQGLPFFIATYLGGIGTDKLSARDPRWIVWVPMIGAALTAPAILVLCTASSRPLAFALLVLPSFANGIYVAPCYAMIQNLSAVHSRATATAVLTFCVNLVGAGLGPLAMGLLSNALVSRFGEQSLRYAFLSLVPLYAVAAAVFALMSVWLNRDVENARQDSLGMLDGNIAAMVATRD